jgi:two-component system, NarL family, response regulator NreC
MLSPGVVTNVVTMSTRVGHGIAAIAPADSPPGESESESGAGASITIVLADDHQVVRSGLRLLLDAEEGFEVLGEAGDVAATRQRVLDYRPRVLVLDLNMSGESSLSAIPQLREESPGTAIVVLTMQDDPAFAREALRTGALGYVLKEAADGELVKAVRLASEGLTYVNPLLRDRLATEQPHLAGPPDDLSPRELEVLRLIGLGHTNGEVASALYLSVRTVESHRAHIQQKTGRTTRAELVGYARENDLLG